MSINMSMIVRWGVVLNTSSYQWHELQHAIAIIAEKTYIFEIGQSFKKLCEFNIELGKDLELYARRDLKNADIEFIVLRKQEGGAE